MPIIKHAAAATAAALLMTQPCLAAPDFRDTTATERRSSAFAGVRLRLPIGTGHAERPSARMQLSTIHEYRNASGATVRSVRPDGLELGLNQRGRLAFSVAGQDVRQTQEQMRLGGGTSTYLIIGGVVLAVVILAVALAPPSPGVDFDD